MKATSNEPRNRTVPGGLVKRISSLPHSAAAKVSYYWDQRPGVLADGGRHWPAETELLLYGSAVGSQSVGGAEMSRFSVGLPATTLTAAGDLLVVYYAGSETDHTAVHWIRLGQ